MEMMMQNLMMQGTTGNAVSASGGKVSQNTSSKEENMFFQMMNGMKEQALAGGSQVQPEDGSTAENTVPMPEGMAQLAALWMQLQIPQGQSPLQNMTVLQQPGQTAEGTASVSLTAETAQNSAGNVQSTLANLEDAGGIRPEMRAETGISAETVKLPAKEAAAILTGAGTVSKDQPEILQDTGQPRQPGNAAIEGQTAEGRTAESVGMKTASQAMSGETGNSTELMNRQDSGMQAQLSGEAAQMQEGRPVTAANQTAPAQRSQETMTFKESAPAENIQRLSELVEKTVKSGVREIEVQLEPAELGRIVIKASYEFGKASVLLTCSSDKAADILSSHAAELGGILKDRMGGPTQIVLERQPEQYLDQDQNGHGGQQADPEQEERREQQQKKERCQALESDFLQQLRLGIV